MSATLRPDYFDAVYSANADPWSFETSPYEAGKYTETLAALGDRRFANAFEIGCSIGVLTERLAPRCGHLLSVDVNEGALASARARCASLQQVEFRRMEVPREFPEGRFDLVLMSEVGYYWSAPDLAHALQSIVAALNPGGMLLMVHWTPVVDDYPGTGDSVHEAALALAGPGGPLVHGAGHRHESYRLDAFGKVIQP